MPQGALALFGRNGPFSTLAWYRATMAHALPPGTSAAFLVAERSGAACAVLPMLRGPGRRLAALVTPYTCLWQPLAREGANPADWRDLGVCLGGLWRRCPLVRLDALDASPLLDSLTEGVRASGLHPLRFAHFGNWHQPVDRDGAWPGYLAARPAALRETIRRRTRRLVGDLGARFSVCETAENLEHAIADYEEIYAASWKIAEPFPRFNAAFMREAAASSMLRLGFLHLDGAPIAAQFWIVHGGTATVLKLAHAETHRSLSPGTVLTALMIQRLLETESITELDFGRGDDAYKRLWAGQRRQRMGVLIANPATLQGAVAIARHAAGVVGRKVFFSEEKKQETFSLRPGPG